MLADTNTEDETNFKQSFNSFKQKSHSQTRDNQSTFFPAARLNQKKELNYQLAPQLIGKEYFSPQAQATH